MVEAWRAEHAKDWNRAASLWRSLDRVQEEARCLDRAARKVESWLPDAGGQPRPGSGGDA